MCLLNVGGSLLRRRLLSMSLMFLLLLVLVPIQIGVVRADVSATTSISQQTMIVILVEFSDLKHTTSQDKMHAIIFSGLNKYYSEVSYSQIGFTGKTVGWYQLPNPEAYYATGRGLNANWSRVRPFVKAAVDAADDDVDFSRYSYVVVVHAGEMAPLWHSFYASPGTIRTPVATNEWAGSNRVTVKDCVVLAEKNDLGVIVHEVGHYLGGVKNQHVGLPDLYDSDLQNEGKYAQVFMGSWCLMSVANGQGMCAWTKLKLGWISTRAVVTVFPWRLNATATIDPLELPTSATHVVMIPLVGKTYYLVEVRQQIGVDKILPGSGVLITFADDSPYESSKKGPVRAIDSTPETTTLDDATFDLRQGKKNAFFDRENNLSIVIVGRSGSSYKIFVGTVSEGEVSVKQQDKISLSTTISSTTGPTTMHTESRTSVEKSLPEVTSILIPATVVIVVLIGIVAFLASRKSKKNTRSEAFVP